MPLSRAFLSLGISSELPLFCSVIPTPQMQVAVEPVLAWQRGKRVKHWHGRVLWESQWQISHVCGTSEICVLFLRGFQKIMEEKLKEGVIGCAFINYGACRCRWISCLMFSLEKACSELLITLSNSEV